MMDMAEREECVAVFHTNINRWFSLFSLIFKSLVYFFNPSDTVPSSLTTNGITVTSMLELPVNPTSQHTQHVNWNSNNSAYNSSFRTQPRNTISIDFHRILYSFWIMDAIITWNTEWQCLWRKMPQNGLMELEKIIVKNSTIIAGGSFGKERLQVIKHSHRYSVNIVSFASWFSTAHRWHLLFWCVLSILAQMGFFLPNMWLGFRIHLQHFPQTDKFSNYYCSSSSSGCYV